MNYNNLIYINLSTYPDIYNIHQGNMNYIMMYTASIPNQVNTEACNILDIIIK